MRAQPITSANTRISFPSFSHAFVQQLPVSVGLGIYAPYGGNIDWPQNTGFRTIATEGSLKYFRINPVIALKLAPNLSIGGGVMVDYGKIDLESGLLANHSHSPISSGFKVTAGPWVTTWVFSGNRSRWFPSGPPSAARHSSPWMATPNSSNRPGTTFTTLSGTG